VHELLLLLIVLDDWLGLWRLLLYDHVLLLGFLLHEHEALPVLGHLACEAFYLGSVHDTDSAELGG
jgi:hypothetical protein